MRAAALAVSAALFTLSSPCRAQEVVAVLSSSPGPYQAAYEGFVKAFGRKIPSFRLPARPATARARVIVAFGGEAALQSYSETSTLIVCMAPGILSKLAHGGPVSFVTMKPHPAELLAQMKTVQPATLKRLAVLGSSHDSELYMAELRRAALTVGLEIVGARVNGPDGVPDALRSFVGKADAIWLAPDPALITPETFQAIKQFSWDHEMPFYAPTAGLAAAGAAVAVSIAPEEAGRQASELARQALAGDELPEFVYPDKTQLTVNLPSAAKAKLTIGADAVGKADKVIR